MKHKISEAASTLELRMNKDSDRTRPHLSRSLTVPTDVGSGGWNLISPINMQRLRSNPTGALGLWKICIILYAQRSVGHGGKIRDAEDSKASTSKCCRRRSFIEKLTFGCIRDAFLV